MVAHISAMTQGIMHLALAVVIGFSDLPAWIEAGAAVLLILGCALFVAGATANWLQGVGDHFAARSFGWKLLAFSGPLNVIGVCALFIGVLPL